MVEALGFWYYFRDTLRLELGVTGKSPPNYSAALRWGGDDSMYAEDHETGVCTTISAILQMYKTFPRPMSEYVVNEM